MHARKFSERHAAQLGHMCFHCKKQHRFLIVALQQLSIAPRPPTRRATMATELDPGAARRLREALDVLAGGELPECPVCKPRARAPSNHPTRHHTNCTRILLQALTSPWPRMRGSCGAARRSCARRAYRAATPLVRSVVRPSKRMRLKTASRRTRTAQRTTASTHTSARHTSTRARATQRLAIIPRTRPTPRLTIIPTRRRLTPPAETTPPAQITPRSPPSIARRLPDPVSRVRDSESRKCP